MMMSKPAPESSTTTTKVTPPAPLAVAAAKPKNSSEAVADLERRLAQLGSSVGPSAPAAAATMPTMASAPAPAAAAPSKAGKNPLLARIMAAQERNKVAPAPTVAALDPFSASKPAASSDPPPPSFDDMLLPPPSETAPSAPPPMFDPMALPPPQMTAASAPPTSATAPTFTFDPHAPPPSIDQVPMPPPPADDFLFAPPPLPSAPHYDDLLETTQNNYQNNNFLPPPVQAPNSSSAEASGLDLDEVMGLQGLSEEEKRELLAEQEKILKSIESNKTQIQAQSATARADAFESRSHQAAVQAIARGGVKTSNKPAPKTVSLGGKEVALHGQESTQQAIQDGTALMVQCMACENWMQVTQSATLMFCPVCQTVSPVLQEDAEMAAQMQRDMALAEQLQKEEYKNAETAERRQQSRSATNTSSSSAGQTAGASASTPGWLEWMGITGAAGTAQQPPDRSFAQAPLQRGEMGVSRPPGSSSSNRSGAGGGLVSATTDSFSTSASSSPTTRQQSASAGARIAEQKPLFSCVADSITASVSSLAQTLYQDEEGNVHGVDSSSLLAVPTIGRNSSSDGGGAGSSSDSYYKAQS